MACLDAMEPGNYDHENDLGLATITSGEVDVFGRNIKGNEKRIYPRIGAIIETPGFYPNLTGTENLEFLQSCAAQRPLMR